MRTENMRLMNVAFFSLEGELRKQITTLTYGIFDNVPACYTHYKTGLITTSEIMEDIENWALNAPNENELAPRKRHYEMTKHNISCNLSLPEYLIELVEIYGECKWHKVLASQRLDKVIEVSKFLLSQSGQGCYLEHKT